MDDFVRTIVCDDDLSETKNEPEKKLKSKNSDVNPSFIFEDDCSFDTNTSNWDYTSSIAGIKGKSIYATTLEEKVSKVLGLQDGHQLTLAEDVPKEMDLKWEDENVESFDEGEEQEEESLDSCSHDESDLDSDESTGSVSFDSDRIDFKEDEDFEDLSDPLQEERKNQYFETVSTSENDSKSFKDLGISRPILKGIAELGYKLPTKIQGNAIPICLSGRDLCAAAETGSGKTGAFIIPIIERLLYRPRNVRASRVLILLPTRELAAQCHSVASKLAKFVDVSVCLAIGGASVKLQEAELRSFPDIIIATPGRLVDHLRNCPSFALDKIEILVLDEADRMLEIGFNDELEEIVKMCPKGRQTMLFSATMTDTVDDLIKLSLNHPVKLFVDNTNAVASKLSQEFIRIRNNDNADRYAILLAICKHLYRGRCIIFIQSKIEAHKVCILFNLLGLKACELHGSLSQLQRLESLERFRDGKSDFMIATDLASRGLDIKSVQTVINFNMPLNFKTYLHRVGRTARAGNFGRSVSFIGEQDRKMLKMAMKHAKESVKHRKIPHDLCLKYVKIFKELQPKIKEIIEVEKEEKMMAETDRDMKRAENLIHHEKEIFSRPAKTFLDKSQSKQGKPKKKLSDDDLKAAKEQKIAAKSVKSQNRPKRLSDMTSSNNQSQPKKDSKKGKRSSGSASFEEDLSSKAAAKKPFRSSAKHAFKSKKRYKRR